MHCLEYILMMTSVAVARDKIRKAELVRVLETLAGASHGYVPEPFANPAGGPRDADETLGPMNDRWHRRFGHLMHTEV